tara:strand:+ start:693 stop:1943 length:1251 start_codon:yes stop_codon:yes gene_type:complete
MKIATAKLQKLLSTERDLLDVKAERVAEDIKRDLLKEKLDSFGWWIKWLLGTIVILWISFKFQLVASTTSQEFTEWFTKTEQDFVDKYGSEKYGYHIGAPDPLPPTVNKMDILLCIQYPAAKGLLDLAAAGKYITRTGAYFLREIITRRSHTLRYEHWHGDASADNDLKHFLPTFHVGLADCKPDESRVFESSSFDYVSIMEAWACKQYAKGHPRQFEKIDKPFCAMDLDDVYYGIDDRMYMCHNDSTVVRRARGNGHRIYKLTLEQKKIGIEHTNPWADFFGFADANELSNNKAVQEHLCSPPSQSTLLRVLFREGLVGVATYMATDIDSEASELVDKLIGSYGNPDLVKSHCTAEKFQSAADGFALVGGIGVALAGSIPGGAIVQRVVAGASLLGGGAAAYSMYNNVDCGYEFR